MRAYFFGNMYLSSIQQGIQATHCLAEMFVKYSYGFERSQTIKTDTLFEWAKDHKTTILLNGGEKADLTTILLHLMGDDNPYPWARFNESDDALNCCLTCVGIILPEKMYSDEAKSYVRSEAQRGPGDTVVYQYEVPKLSRWEFELIEITSQCGLAR